MIWYVLKIKFISESFGKFDTPIHSLKSYFYQDICSTVYVQYMYMYAYEWHQ